MVGKKKERKKKNKKREGVVRGWWGKRKEEGNETEGERKKLRKVDILKVVKKISILKNRIVKLK